MKIRVKFMASVMMTMNTKKLGSDVIMKTVVDGTTIGVLFEISTRMLLKHMILSGFAINSKCPETPAN